MKIRTLASNILPALLLGLLSSCGDPGPVGHVDFDAEFQDTSKVKVKATDYGSEQEKEYKDLVLAEKEYEITRADIDTLFTNAQTTSPHDASSKLYKSQLSIDAEVKWDRADAFLNSASTSLQVTSKECTSVTVSTSVNGVDLEYRVSKGFVGQIFYSFDDYKKDCEDELKNKLYALSDAKKFRYSYLHLQRSSDPALKEVTKVKLKITPLERTTLVRKLYSIKPAQLRAAYDLFMAEFAKTEAPLSNPQDPASERVLRDGNITIQMDKNHTTFTSTSLKLNGKKDQAEADAWKQGVYDPVSGVVRSVFTPIFMMPFEIVTRVMLSPFGRLDDEPIFKSFLFSKCHDVNISTTLLGVAMRIEEPRTRQDSDACYAELESFFNGRPVKFDYLRSAVIPKPTTD